MPIANTLDSEPTEHESPSCKYPTPRGRVLFKVSSLVAESKTSSSSCDLRRNEGLSVQAVECVYTGQLQLALHASLQAQTQGQASRCWTTACWRCNQNSVIGTV